MKNKKSLIPILIGLIFMCAISLIFGFWYGRKEIVIYKHNETIDVFPKNAPVYGVPMADYASIWLALKYGLNEKAEARINYFLKSIGLSASLRLRYATEEERKILSYFLSDAELESYTFR